jgi:pimeloyl-ACP methyl ester carboxylesterase
MTEPYRMAFEDSADRVPVLLIHGYPLNNTLWDLQVGDLSDIARIITPDLRGHGLSDPVEPPYAMADMADDCARLLDDLGLTGPVVVGGLSMGGYVAFEFCRKYPERVMGLILAATKPGADSAEVKKARDAAAETARKDGVEVIADGMLPKMLVPGAVESAPEMAAFVKRMMMETTVDGIVGALGAMRDRPDSTPDLPKLAVPTLVIHGADDQLIPRAEAEAMADALPEATLAIAADAGHLPCLEQPEFFNDTVREFLEGFYE